MMDWLFCTTTPQLFWQLCPKSSWQIINWKTTWYFCDIRFVRRNTTWYFCKLTNATKLGILRKGSWHFLQIIQRSTTYSFIASTEGSGLDGHWPLFWQQRLRQRQKYQINADFLTTRTIGKLGPEQFLANIRRQILGKRDSHSKSRKVINTSV